MGSLSALSAKYKAALLLAVVGLCLCGVSAVYGSRGVTHLRELWMKQEALEALAFRLQTENDRVQEHLRRLETDDGYLERLARERLGWAKPGELVYRVDQRDARGPAVPTLSRAARPSG